MSEIEFVERSTVKLVESNAQDLMVAKAAWVSNFGEDGNLSLPKDLKTIAWRQRYGLESWEEEDIKRIKGLINFLYRNRHMSPFEHGSFTFAIDTPIFVAREFMRHRTFSYNETSGRYKELEPRFYLLNDDRPVVQKGKVGAYSFDTGSDEQYGIAYAATTLAYGSSWAAYQKMLSLGIAREVARNVLPVGTMTQFYATCNPRNLMQFLALRDDEHALYEIRDVARQMKEIFAAKMPFTYQAFEKYQTDWNELDTLRKKVAQLEAYESYSVNIDQSRAHW